jgi:hypothetical protein
MLVSPVFVAINSTNLIFIFEKVHKNFKTAEIWVWSPGARKNPYGSRVQKITGSRIRNTV